ncbi:MAG TPA: UvrD-helicase domain-containing protein [Methylotenera sp.]|nr:UvrD-helicase domain-containing protein [Methylotenera sp.]HPH04366.1 UvrD-helicase domain-containing protein [Methylotenera sp.]HPM99920.1 UvrD-helicase domain-containing protein [Methylotenera sp.]
MTIDLNILDAANRERALALESFIVEAPAGAGKTELLTQRYLKLLAIVNEPEEIIALTFTNKAAAEMRNRIMLSLENAQNQTSETAAHKLKTRELANAALARSQVQGWDILAQPSRLRILTIDALCSSLTRQMPLLSKFGGQPAVSDDANVHYNEAARRAIAHIVDETEADGVVTEALSYLDNNSEKLTSLLANMLAMRDQWLPLAVQLHQFDSAQMLANNARALRHLMAADLQAALNAVPTNVQAALMPLARFAASNLETNAEIAPLLDWQTPLTADADNIVQWQALANLLVTKSEQTYRKSVNKNNGFPAEKEHKDKKDAFLAIVNTLENSEAVAKVLSLPSIHLLAENEQIILSLTKLLMLASEHLWLVFQAAGEVDFIAIAQSAELALENEQGATDLALKLDYKISHLLVDEFQDTSPVQMGLIEKLIAGWQHGDGRTLFCVGDPMQSIYRFRKADVSLFLQAATKGIGHLPLTRLQLSKNNRSHPAVVSWINQAFQTVFPVKDDIDQGAISYRAFTATRDTVAGEGVVMHPLVLDAQNKAEHIDIENDEGVSENIKQLEARYVTNLLVKLKAEKPQSIAVLVRSRSHLRELVSEIRRNHASLAFQAVEIEQLNARQTVQDAFSLVCALHHRADRTHWLNVLRAPWCGLTLADLHTLAADNHSATIWQLMHEYARLQRLSADGLLRLNHVKNVFTHAFSAQGRQPARRWVESTWLQLGGGKCLVDAGDNRDVQAFFDLVEKTARRGTLDIAVLEEGLKKLYAKPDIDADGSVQFLTIHKSKGLEFDTVILPALNRKPRNDDNALVLWQEVMVDNHLRLIAAPLRTKNAQQKNPPPSIYDYIKALEKTRASNEVVRLLYVAATRTQRQLHIVASMQTDKEGQIKPLANSLLQVLWPAVEAQFKQSAILLNETANKNLDISQFKSQLQRLPSEHFLQSFLPQLKSALTEMTSKNIENTQNESVEISFDTALTVQDLQKHCGTLAHLYMELMANADLQTWQGARLQQCLPAMQKWLIQQGHDETNAQHGAAIVLNMLHTTIASQAGQWVLKAHTNAASELALTAQQHTNAKNYVIDRTFVEYGVRWIVDYKTSALENNLTMSELSSAAELHRQQLESYAQLFADEGLPLRLGVLFLNLGKLVELKQTA